MGARMGVTPFASALSVASPSYATVSKAISSTNSREIRSVTIASRFIWHCVGFKRKRNFFSSCFVLHGWHLHFFLITSFFSSCFELLRIPPVSSTRHTYPEIVLKGIPKTGEEYSYFKKSSQLFFLFLPLLLLVCFFFLSTSTTPSFPLFPDLTKVMQGVRWGKKKVNKKVLVKVTLWSVGRRSDSIERQNFVVFCIFLPEAWR